MHVHILGICGTFMGSLALLARALGHTVSGSDEHVYPPMSTQLREQGIDLIEGYEHDRLTPEPDLVIVGNAMSRGKPVVERLLNSHINYVSGPQWLAQEVLSKRWVLAVAGTHGKTTTSSMLAWVLRYANLNPGYLIGGIPKNFSVSAELGDAPFFVVEADEYDSAFFDKRSKFVHYRPRTAILNNLEFDHADIFPNLEAIKTQFHHLVRTVPENGLIVRPEADGHLRSVLEQGCWTPVETFTIAAGAAGAGEGGWSAHLTEPDGSKFDVLHCGKKVADVAWDLTGLHSVHNGLACMLAARHAGVPMSVAAAALSEFQSVKRRMEVIYSDDKGITVYDDFAHHPTAIQMTLEGLRARVQRLGRDGRIMAIIEPRSNTMRQGVHQDELLKSVQEADRTVWFKSPDIDWDIEAILHQPQQSSEVVDSLASIVRRTAEWVRPNDHVVIMSNGGFGGVHKKIVVALASSARTL